MPMSHLKIKAIIPLSNNTTPTELMEFRLNEKESIFLTAAKKVTPLHINDFRKAALGRML